MSNSRRLLAQGMEALESEAQQERRVPRAADAGRDPALPALPPQFQPEPAEGGAVAPAAALVPPAFDASTLDGMDPGAQVETLEAAYWDADRSEIRSFQLAKMVGSVLKGELLELLLDRRAHEHRGLTVGDYADSLGIKRQYVYDLIGAARDIRVLAPLIEETATPLVAAQAAVLAPLYKADPATAGLVLQGARESGRLSAASLTQAAIDLGLMSGSKAAPQKPAPTSTPASAGLLAFADAYRALAPKRVDAMVQEDPGAVLVQAEAIEAELLKVQRRVDAAKKAARQALKS
ncbi:hypothetical protein [Streptomyces subrutilus]|uniref:hypothetical protein n=1 Tax=Streptomyces subrutilus TaxID=36818 RepID=UPI00340FC605